MTPPPADYHSLPPHTVPRLTEGYDVPHYPALPPHYPLPHLFGPDDVTIFCDHLSRVISFFHQLPLDYAKISAFAYNPADASVTALLASGKELDLGMLIPPALQIFFQEALQAKRKITVMQTKDGEKVMECERPLILKTPIPR